MDLASIMSGFAMPFLLGLAGGLTPGPVLAAIFARILQDGLSRSLGIVFWALLIETLVALISLVGLSFLRVLPVFFDALSLLGALLLLWIALQLWRTRGLAQGRVFHFRKGQLAMMILLNGVLWSYWITVCIPQALVLGARVPYGEYIFILLVQTGWLLSTLFAAVAFSRARPWLSHSRVVAAMFRFFALVFVYFAAVLAWGGLVPVTRFLANETAF